jgi:hypothetical protein
MKVYHGSVTVVEQPDVLHSRKNLDFGKGFYVTSYQKQAERWALRTASRKSKVARVTVYEMTEPSAECNGSS